MMQQELQDGYQSNPIVSGLAEVGGAGMIDANNPAEYAVNIGLNTAGSITGEKFGSILGDKANDLLKERAKNLSFALSKSARALTKMGANSLTNQINNWRKDNE